MPPSSDIAFSPSVKAVQQRRGSRAGYAKMEGKGGFATLIDESLAEFIASQRSFYLATVNADGQPYIQHRGGPPGVSARARREDAGLRRFQRQPAIHLHW